MMIIFYLLMKFIQLLVQVELSSGSIDASNILKPALTTGNLKCIGSTTYKEYRNYFEKDRALM